MEPLSIVRKWVATYVGESGKHESDPDVLEAINEARRIIYPVGDWKDTMESVALATHGSTVTLPNWAEVIRKAWTVRGHEFDLPHGWYDYVATDTFLRLRSHELQLIDLGQRYASFQPYSRNFRLKVLTADNDDAGLKISFNAVNEYGAPVLLTRTMNTAGLPIISEPADDRWIRSFSSAQKPVTKDRVFVYIYDPVRHYESLCAVYEGPDINPQYRRYRVPTAVHPQILAKVKKKFVEITDDRQLVDIHTDALIHLMQGITARRNRDMAGYAAGVTSAKNFLDAEIKSEAPVKTSYMKMSPMYKDTNLGFGDCCGDDSYPRNRR